MSEFTNVLKESENKAEQTRMSRDQHLETIADTIEWLDDASFLEVFGCEERLDVHEVANLRVLQAY